MKIVYIISNFIYSAVSLLFLYVIYTDHFGTGSFLKLLSPALNKIITTVFSEYNIIGLFIIDGICILFAVLTVILLIKNLIQKQNVTSFVLSAISIISMIGFIVLTVPWESSFSKNPTLYSLTKWFCLFNTVMITVQIIASVINTVKSYSIEYSE